MTATIPTASDRANLSNVPQGLAALREVRRELRRARVDRNDRWLLRCCAACGILIDSTDRRADAIAVTHHAAARRDRLGWREPQRWRRAEAVASDLNTRAAIKRLLDVNPDAVQRCAAAPVEWHTPIDLSTSCPQPAPAT